MKKLQIITIAISLLAAVSTFSFTLGAKLSKAQTAMENVNIISNKMLYSNHTDLPEVIVIAKK